MHWHWHLLYVHTHTHTRVCNVIISLCNDCTLLTRFFFRDRTPNAHRIFARYTHGNICASNHTQLSFVDGRKLEEPKSLKRLTVAFVTVVHFSWGIQLINCFCELVNIMYCVLCVQYIVEELTLVCVQCV